MTMPSNAALDHFPTDLILAAKAGMINAATTGQYADDAAIAGNIDYFVRAGLAEVFRKLASSQEILVTAFSRAGDNTNANTCASKQQQYLQWASNIDASNPVPT